MKYSYSVISAILDDADAGVGRNLTPVQVRDLARFIRGTRGGLEVLAGIPTAYYSQGPTAIVLEICATLPRVAQHPEEYDDTKYSED